MSALKKGSKTVAASEPKVSAISDFLLTDPHAADEQLEEQMQFHPPSAINLQKELLFDRLG